MRKYSVLAVLLYFALTSCLTQKRCYRKFPIQADTVRIGTIKDSVAYRDTLIYITIPGATVVDSVFIPCPPPPSGFIPDTARAETQLARAIAYWDYPKIRLQLIQKDLTITSRLDSAIREIYHWKTKYEKIVAISPKKTPIPVIYKLALGFSVIFFLAVIISFLLFLFGRKGL